MKTRAAKALTAAVVIGGTLFATGGTSFAVGTLPNGAAVTATGTGDTLAKAEADAQAPGGESVSDRGRHRLFY